MNNIKNLVIAMLVILLIWFSATIVRLENYHYANQTGMCDLDKFDGNIIQKKVSQSNCFKTVETRTNPIWHLVYALLNE
jgi:hypothetical protein